MANRPMVDGKSPGELPSWDTETWERHVFEGGTPRSEQSPPALPVAWPATVLFTGFPGNTFLPPPSTRTGMTTTLLA